mgnify:CR=1 FL=1
MSSSSGAARGASPPASPILCHERLLDFGVDVETATASVINRAYRRKALEAHPDKGGGADEFRRLKSKCEELQRCFQVFETYKRKHLHILFADCAEREGSSQRPDHPPRRRGIASLFAPSDSPSMACQYNFAGHFAEYRRSVGLAT